MDLLTGLIARQQILLKRPDLTKVLTLTVDPESYWIYTNTPVDNARVAETFQQYGFEAGMLCTDGEWKPVFHQED